MAEASKPDGASKGAANSILKAFNNFRSLVNSQAESVRSFDAKTAYATGPSEEVYSDAVIEFYNRACEDMKIGADVEEGWTLNLRYMSKGIVDGTTLYGNLRLLPDHDVRKIRFFNRFVGQEFFQLSIDDIFFNQQAEGRSLKNPFFDKLQENVRQFAELLGMDVGKVIAWPALVPERADRDILMRAVGAWRDRFLALPGVRLASGFFSPQSGLAEPKAAFHEFFHTQRQFDSENWKDFDEQNRPHPQPLPRITSYRKAILDLNTEFLESEGNISMCYDYCRMKKDVIINYVRSAEDSFIRIVNRLDDDYPVSVDYGHRRLHDRSKALKHMLFPLRCLFYEELDEQRGVKESNDNTLDSYFEMSLGNTFVSIPPHYYHSFNLEDLEPELREALSAMLSKADPTLAAFRDDKGLLCARAIMDAIQHDALDRNLRHSTIFEKISENYEQKFKRDENNISRRMARLCWLFTSAMAKQKVLHDACKTRLDSVQALSTVYFNRATQLSKVNLEDEHAYMKLTDDQLPLIAPPEQMEDFYHTRQIVGRLAVENAEFEDQARQIALGLSSSLDMLKKSELFLENLVTRIFPNEADRKDLVEAIKRLISLSYQTQQALADVAKREGAARKKKNNAADAKSSEDTERVRALKAEVQQTQEKLKVILGEKNTLVQKMRITDAEKQNYQRKLRMVAVMTVTSVQAQNKIQEGGKNLAAG